MQARLRAKAVMLRAVDRLSLRIMRAAFETWREAARARKARRLAMARFMQRWGAWDGKLLLVQLLQNGPCGSVSRLAALHFSVCVSRAVKAVCPLPRCFPVLL